MNIEFARRQLDLDFVFWKKHIDKILDETCLIYQTIVDENGNIEVKVINKNNKLVAFEAGCIFVGKMPDQSIIQIPGIKIRTISRVSDIPRFPFVIDSLGCEDLSIEQVAVGAAFAKTHAEAMYYKNDNHLQKFTQRYQQVKKNNTLMDLELD